MFELLLLCPQDRVDWVSDALEALDALSVSVEDADAHTPAEQALFGEPGMPIAQEAWLRSRVVSLFAQQTQADEAVALLGAQDDFADCTVLGIRSVADQDWVRLTQSQFAPVEITPTFWIVPSWHEPPAQALQTIRLDPGLAFGTGTHPTTYMCLRWIAKQAASGAQLGRTLDYGCGSGILAIAAQIHGAQPVVAVDIDPAAVTAALDNAKANDSYLDVVGLPDAAQGEYDTVLANILASPLKVLAPLLCGYLAKDGRLVLAGILERQTEELQSAYAPYVQLRVADSMDGWVLMTAEPV